MEHPQELAWNQGEAETVAIMGTINAGFARLVSTIRMLLDTDGWQGWGIRSPEHWVTWKTAVSPRRAEELVLIARRIHELPACWTLFEQGRITQDAMARIARRVPADMDAAVARQVPDVTIRQLDRALAACPPLEDETAEPTREPERQVLMGPTRDGWLSGSFCLPPDEGAVLRNGLMAARDAEYRDRKDLEPDADLDDGPEHLRRPGVSWADALVRMASEGADALDATLHRTGCRGDRNKVILHTDVGPDGSMGPGQLHLGPTVPDTVRRYLMCDAEVMVAAYEAGRLIGISPTTRTVNRHLRRLIERRDQGCSHPLCGQRLWLHVHHIQFWDNGGETIPSNLIALCPKHHRELHCGDFSIEGDPDSGTARFRDRRGRPIEPLVPGPPVLPDLREPSAYRPPCGERLSTLWFSWN